MEDEHLKGLKSATISLPLMENLEVELLKCLDKSIIGLDIQILLDKMLSAYYRLENFEECKKYSSWLIDCTWEKLNTGHWKDVQVTWRYMYTVATLFKVAAMSKLKSDKIQEILGVCDMGLLMGAPMFDNLLSKYAAVLNSVSNEKLPKRSINPNDKTENRKRTKFVSHPVIDEKKSISVLSEPSLENFKLNYFSTKTPLIITDAVQYWPAFSNRRWSVNYYIKSIEYIKQIAGNRTVPIELGSRYTDDDWSQKLMTVSDFIDNYVDAVKENIGYLAQHQLFDQIPELGDDIVIPTYCGVGEMEDVDINAWFGPCGTVSPLHQDPKHNFLVQVIGEKYVRLYNEAHSHLLCPHEGSLLFNTSQIDVENPDVCKFPHFNDIPYQECILKAGEMLYIPPKCWHYVRSLTVSFSVSFWWE